MRRVSRNRSRTWPRPASPSVAALFSVVEEFEGPAGAFVDGVDEVAAFAVLELEGDAAGASGDHGCPFPERFGDDEPESLTDGFLDHDLGEALEGVDLDVADAGEVGEEVNVRVVAYASWIWR